MKRTTIWTDGETTATLVESGTGAATVELEHEGDRIYLTTLDLRTMLEIVDRLREQEATDRGAGLAVP